MKFKYKDQIVTASSKDEAIKKIKLSELSDKEKKDIFRRAKRGDKSILKLPNKFLTMKENNRFEWNPVHYLAQNHVVEILDLPKSILMSTESRKETPVHRLADTVKKEVIKKLLELPVGLLTMQDKDGETPVHWLAWYRVNRKYVREFPKKVLMIRDNNGQTPVDISELPRQQP